MTVREECKRRHGDKPCIKTPTETADCKDWCPLLNKRLDLELEHMVQLDSFGQGRMKRLPCYTDDERQYFATFANSRASCRPAECNMGPNCWVNVGPPGFTITRPIHPATKGAFCRECSGSVFPGVFRKRAEGNA